MARPPKMSPGELRSAKAQAKQVIKSLTKEAKAAEKVSATAQKAVAKAENALAALEAQSA